VAAKTKTVESLTAEVARLRRALEESEQELASLRRLLLESQATRRGDRVRRELVEHVRASAGTVLPEDARVLVVSRGDDDLLDLGGAHGSHFPQVDGGVYAGHHPGSGAEAVAQLEEVRARGADFLLIPAPSLWWLEHYSELKSHLDTHYPLVHADASCLLFALGEKALRPKPQRALTKAEGEIGYWLDLLQEKGSLSNTHYEFFYTSHFALERSFFAGKKILDVGCGPCGSLEWADLAGERIGLDPLAAAYRDLGVDAHAMTYVCAPAERMPFPDGYFDVVSSFNSLDHVDDLDQAAAEITRVLAPGGSFLLLTDVNHAPTLMEPISYSWNVVEKFLPALELLEERRYERDGEGLYQSLRAGLPHDDANPADRYGVLSAKFVKPLS
jgi:ubiquinone/menaquinone biosynthesis C-methylase UbiE